MRRDRALHGIDAPGGCHAAEAGVNEASKSGGSLELLLLRHAKSAWGDPQLDDHDRGLAPRGVAAAKRVAGELKARGLRPGSRPVLDRDARRADLGNRLGGARPCAALPAYAPTLSGAARSAARDRTRATGECPSAAADRSRPGYARLGGGLGGRRPRCRAPGARGQAADRRTGPDRVRRLDLGRGR